MDKKTLAEKYVARLKRCLLAVKAAVAFMALCIAALLIFFAVVSSTDIKSARPDVALIGVIVPGAAGAAAAVATLIIFLVSGITLKRLKKLGNEEKS